MSNPRDPRVDPQKGDVLRRGHTTRVVIYREFDCGCGQTIMANRVQVCDNAKRDKRPGLKQFRAWAKSAEVIRVAE